jgi:hypothetical protein
MKQGETTMKLFVCAALAAVCLCGCSYLKGLTGNVEGEGLKGSYSPGTGLEISIKPVPAPAPTPVPAKVYQLEK